MNALDYSGYPDCRPEYIQAFEKMANLATRAGVEGRTRLVIRTPLISLSKAAIIKLGASLGVDYSLTTSCYDPGPNGEACGRCDACQLRLKGFSEAGLEDPISYASAGSGSRSGEGRDGRKSTMTYTVKEIFYTLQGEGAHAIRTHCTAVFCRFSGCNLWSGREEDRSRAICQFCDTDFVGTGPDGGKFKSATELADAIDRSWEGEGRSAGKKYPWSAPAESRCSRWMRL